MANIRKQVVLPEDMDREISKAAQDAGTNQSEIVRKAMTLYLMAVQKKKQGLKLGFAKPEQTLETEVIGL
jgi:metal-responsive CopG/Arc/MetJ family transcriptional regulator